VSVLRRYWPSEAKEAVLAPSTLRQKLLLVTKTPEVLQLSLLSVFANLEQAEDEVHFTNWTTPESSPFDFGSAFLIKPTGNEPDEILLQLPSPSHSIKDILLSSAISARVVSLVIKISLYLM